MGLQNCEITIIMFKLILFNEMRVNIISGRILCWDIRIKYNVPQKDNYNSDIRLSRVISEPLNQIRRGAQKNKNKQENATDVQKLIIIILNMLFILFVFVHQSRFLAYFALLLITCWLTNKWYCYHMLSSFQVCTRVFHGNQLGVICWKRWNQNWKCHTLHRKTAGIFLFSNKIKNKLFTTMKGLKFCSRC